MGYATPRMVRTPSVRHQIIPSQNDGRMMGKNSSFFGVTSTRQDPSIYDWINDILMRAHEWTTQFPPGISRPVNRWETDSSFFLRHLMENTLPALYWILKFLYGASRKCSRSSVVIRTRMVGCTAAGRSSLCFAHLSRKVFDTPPCPNS